MKKENLIAIIVVALVFITPFGYRFYNEHREKVLSCTQGCYYVPSKEPSGGLISDTSKGDYWGYGSRKFETQKQCTDYCLTK